MFAQAAAEHGGAEEGGALVHEEFAGEHGGAGVREGLGEAAGKEPAARALFEQFEGVQEFLASGFP